MQRLLSPSVYLWFGNLLCIFSIVLCSMVSHSHADTQKSNQNQVLHKAQKKSLNSARKIDALRVARTAHAKSIQSGGSGAKTGKNVVGLRSKKNRRKKKLKDPNRLEWGVLPAIAGNTDTGVGFGLLMNLAKFAPGFYPYKWRIELLIYMTAKEAPGGGVELPYHDYYVYFDFPGLAGGKLRLDGKLSFSRFTTAGYFGIGNASVFKKPWEDAKYTDIDSLSASEKARYIQLRRTYQYDRIYPSIRLNARYTLPHKLSFYVGSEFAYNWINMYPGSKLEEDVKKTRNLSDQSPEAQSLRGLLFGAQAHGEWILKVGLVFDNRDHEATPNSGMFHDLSFRFAPGAVHYPYAGLTLNSRFFIPIWKPYLVVALRVLGDVLFGDVPFYELARFGGLFPGDMTGGSSSVRGIINNRYHGKIKLLANLEIRSKIIFFNIGSARFNIGLIAFADMVRVWSDFTPHPILDGEDVGIRFAFGGGLRIQWGESFVVRADYGFSMTETDSTDPTLPFTGSSTGLYITVSHAF